MYQKWLAAACLAAALVVTGCGQEQPAEDSQEMTDVTLPGSTWQIEDIDAAGIVDSSMITMQFAADGRVAGSTGCNRYFAGVSLRDDQLSFSQAGSTRRACAPALMDQEQRFLEALQGVTRYRVDEQGLLLLFDADGVQRLRGVRIAADPTATGEAGSEPQEQAPDE